MAKNEAVFLPINCVNAHRTFYARYDFAYDGAWVLTYGLKDIPLDVSGGSGSGEGREIDLLNSRTGPQYRCPYCGNTSFVQCGACHCGHTGEVSGTIDSLEGDKRRSQV